MSDLLTQAVSLAQQGYRVLPLKPGTRIPNLKDWQQLATSDTETITKWWKRRPNANVGIATGRTFLVIDVDVKNGKSGLQSLAELRAAHSLPKTYTVKTPSGGLHLDYKHPGADRPIKNQVNWYPGQKPGVRKGIDIRADEGQVVAPGMEVTEFPGKPYTVAFDIPMAELPKSLTDLLPYREKDHAADTHFSEKPSHSQSTASYTTPNHRWIPTSWYRKQSW